jgi:hypothetical protein
MPRVRPAPFGRASSLRLLGEILQFLLLGLRAAQAPAPLLCAGWKRRLASRGALTCSSTAQRQRLQGSSGCLICAATVTAVAVTYKRGCSPCVHCVHAWDAAQSKSLCPAASVQQPLSWLREETQRHGNSTASGEAKEAPEGGALPLVTKVPCLTKPPSSYMKLSLSPSSDQLLCLPACCTCLPGTPHPNPTCLHSLETLTLRSRSLVPGLTRTCLLILAKDSKFHSKVKSELTYRLHLCSCDVNCCCP